MRNIVFFDVDKTLVDHKDWTVPCSTLEALARLKAAGDRLYVNTSRSVNEMANVTGLLAPLGLDGMVLTGGAHTVVGGETVRRVDMDPAAAEKLVHRLEAEGQVIRWQMEREMYFHEDPPENIVRVLTELFGEVAPTRRWNGEGLQRIITYAGPELVEELRRLTPGLRFLDQGHNVVNCTEAGVDKATGMLAEAYRLGYTRERVVAFGDGLNDCDMLGCAGIGVAMGNAHPVTKAAADYVTTAVGEDGIYNACVHLGLI